MRNYLSIAFSLLLAAFALPSCLVGSNVRVSEIQMKEGQPQVFHVTKVDLYYYVLTVVPVVRAHLLCTGDANGDLNCK